MSLLSEINNCTIAFFGEKDCFYFFLDHLDIDDYFGVELHPLLLSIPSRTKKINSTRLLNRNTYYSPSYVL